MNEEKEKEEKWQDYSNSVSSEEEDIVEETQASNDFPACVTSNSFIDQLIIRLMTAKQPKPRKSQSHRISRTSPVQHSTVPVELKYEELEKLCNMSCESFSQQKSLIVLEKDNLPIVVCADIHGQFQDLREIFIKCGSPHQQNYLFLGDYIDRGTQGIPTFSLLLCLKIKYPSKVFLLRGNHEDVMASLSYGFYDECLLQFIHSEENHGEMIYKKFIDVFCWMPFAAVIAKSIFCVHGGLSPHLDKLESIEKIVRPCIIPPYGLACDLLWSDPFEPEPEEGKRNGWSMSVRGISFAFSQTMVEEFCQRLSIDLIVRGHQLLKGMLKNGYTFFSGGRLVTLFSARNYMNMGNSSAVLRISDDLKCRFIVFRMRRNKLKESKTERPRVPSSSNDK